MADARLYFKYGVARRSSLRSTEHDLGWRGRGLATRADEAAGVRACLPFLDGKPCVSQCWMASFESAQASGKTAAGPPTTSMPYHPLLLFRFRWDLEIWRPAQPILQLPACTVRYLACA